MSEQKQQHYIYYKMKGDDGMVTDEPAQKYGSEVYTDYELAKGRADQLQHSPDGNDKVFSVKTDPLRS